MAAAAVPARLSRTPSATRALRLCSLACSTHGPQVGQKLLEGYLRPGCTHLTLNALMSRKRVQEMKVRAGAGGGRL